MSYIILHYFWNEASKQILDARIWLLYTYEDCLENFGLKITYSNSWWSTLQYLLWYKWGKGILLNVMVDRFSREVWVSSSWQIVKVGWLRQCQWFGWILWQWLVTWNNYKNWQSIFKHWEFNLWLLMSGLISSK